MPEIPCAVTMGIKSNIDSDNGDEFHSLDDNDEVGLQGEVCEEEVSRISIQMWT